MLRTTRTLEKIFAVRGKLVVGDAEVVMYRRAFEDALLHAAAFTKLVVVDLNDDTQTLNEEDTAGLGSNNSL